MKAPTPFIEAFLDCDLEAINLLQKYGANG